MADRNWLLIFRRVVFAVFLGLEIWVGWTNYRDIAATQYTASGSLAEWERRLAPLKKIMPLSPGVVGYVSDAGSVGIGYYALDAQIEYMLTQYTMAPIIVAPDSNHDWIIGDLSKEGYNSWLQANPGKFDTISLNYGIYLIHRLDQ
jgi:hypothetical protein